MNLLDLPHDVIRRISNVDQPIPRNSEKDVQNEVDSMEMRMKMLGIGAEFKHLDFGPEDDIRKTQGWPFSQLDSYCFLSSLSIMHGQMDYVGIIQGLHQFLDNELVQVNGLETLYKMMRHQNMNRNHNTILNLRDEIFNVACTSIRAYPCTLSVLDEACGVLYLLLLYTDPSRSQQLYDNKILHVLVKARNHLSFTPGPGFVLKRNHSNLDKLIVYCESHIVTFLSQTHALDYPLPANTDGVALAGPDTVFLNTLPRLVKERNIGVLLAGMRDFILFAVVQEKVCASLWQIVHTNSGAYRMDWYDERVPAPHAPDGTVEPIEENFEEIVSAATQAIVHHPTSTDVMQEACKLLMLTMVTPTWFDALRKSKVVQVLIEASLNFCYKLGDNFILHSVPASIQELLRFAKETQIGGEGIDFDTLEASCVLMAQDVASLTHPIFPLDYHQVCPPNATARGVHKHLWSNQREKFPFW